MTPISGQAMGRISLPLALLGLQAMMVVPMVEGHSNLHITLLGAQAMFTVVVQAQYNVYYGYTAQELQEFIADTVLSSVILPLLKKNFFCLLSIDSFSTSGDWHGCGGDGL